jgi:purine-nucleoside phosphorylase
METAELYTLAAKYGCDALAVLTVSDHLVTGETTDAQERQLSFRSMMEVALDAILA